ncbi:MAG: hypothetical protein K0R08_733 [Solimicrobium sp.]|jgi:hypothetical protein|nr:hypothetical protein [Solimicrobium sp.]
MITWNLFRSSLEPKQHLPVFAGEVDIMPSISSIE